MFAKLELYGGMVNASKPPQAVLEKAAKQMQCHFITNAMPFYLHWSVQKLGAPSMDPKESIQNRTPNNFWKLPAESDYVYFAMVRF